jgi:hypothetical protein
MEFQKQKSKEILIKDFYQFTNFRVFRVFCG